MKYEEQLKLFVDYFKSGEKNPGDFKLGLEMEHFIVYKDSLKAVSYYGDNGVETILERLLLKDWMPVYEDKYLIGLSKNGSTITLEPGGQIELSIVPHTSIKDIEGVYFSFLGDIIPILDNKDMLLIATGYQPESTIDSIELLPKERYRNMYEYFKHRGAYAHNMMKGTSSLQVSIDYSSENDYIRKNRVASYLSSMIYLLFDNVAFFEGDICDKTSMRHRIWEQCDVDRCGFASGTFEDDFGYYKYGEYILNTPPIIVKEKYGFRYTDAALAREVYDDDEITQERIEHLLSMVFPDIRLKKYIEIRMGDALPYPYNIAYAAFWKGIMYNDDNLDKLYKEAVDYREADIDNMKREIHEKGINTSIRGINVVDKFKEFVAMAGHGLNCCEGKYLNVIHDMLDMKKTPRTITLNRLPQGKDKALEWCILNKTYINRRCDDIAWT